MTGGKAVEVQHAAPHARSLEYPYSPSSAIAMGVPGMLMPSSLVRAGTAAGLDSLRGALENGAVPPASPGGPAEAADTPVDAVGVGPRVEV